MEEGLFHSPEFVKEINENAVALLGHRQAGHEPETDPATGKDRCPKYKTITCEQHQKVSSDAGFLKYRGVPTNFIIDASKTVLMDGTKRRPENSSRIYGMILKEAQGKLGMRRIPGTLYADSLRKLTAAEKFLNEGNVKKGLKQLMKVEKRLKNFPKSFSDRYDPVVKTFNDHGQKLLDEALANSDKEAGKKQVKKIAKQYRGLDIADKAKLELKSFN